MKSRRLIPGFRSDGGQGLWLKRATSDRLREGQLSTQLSQSRGELRTAGMGAILPIRRSLQERLHSADFCRSNAGK